MVPTRDRLSFANVVSALALFAALGGGAYAAVKLEANSVGSKQVRDDSLGGRDIKEGKLGQVPSAATADSAADAALLDGVDSSELARRGLEWILVQEAHQSSNPPGRFTRFGSDGVVCDSHFGSHDGAGAEPVRLDIGPDGAVELDQPYESGDWFSLDGIDFPCGPRGASGCP